MTHRHRGPHHTPRDLPEISVIHKAVGCGDQPVGRDERSPAHVALALAVEAHLPGPLTLVCICAPNDASLFGERPQPTVWRESREPKMARQGEDHPTPRGQPVSPLQGESPLALACTAVLGQRRHEGFSRSISELQAPSVVHLPLPLTPTLPAPLSCTNVLRGL